MHRFIDINLHILITACKHEKLGDKNLISGPSSLLQLPVYPWIASLIASASSKSILKYLSCIYFVSGTVLCVGHISEQKKNPVLMKFIALQGRDIISYEYEKKRTIFYSMLESSNYGEEKKAEQGEGAGVPGRVYGEVWGPRLDAHE